MAILNDREILAAINNGELFISSLNFNNVQPASIDLTLHHILETTTLTYLDAAAVNLQLQEMQNSLNVHDITDNGYELMPGQFVTGYSSEKLHIPTFMSGHIFNRNSLARCGLDISTASFVNPGFNGRMVIVILEPLPLIEAGDS